ncbi:hypothetical protein CRG98_012720 [Punica granatum]|uniref:Uncharacterized protein n=1 Tax=Punica granatum TaxID=22663 RepID=A0A2I0KEA9_PUNGR|nr:hypothetical protein CRG98_012720 [Punica granatum]
MGLLKIGLDRWWVGFGLFWLEQTRMAATDPDWASFKSDVTTVAPNGILMQGRWPPTPKIPPKPYKDQTKQSVPRNRPEWARFGSDVTTVAPDGILMQGRWFPTPKRPPEVAVVVVWFQSYRVDPYSLAKITENRVRPRNRPDWARFGSDVTTVAPDGILMQGRCSRLLRDPRRWLWCSFGSRVIGLTRIALQRSRKTEYVLETDPTGQFSGRTSPRWFPMEF